MKILGVPVHAWKENFFEHVAQLVGTFISIDESIREKVRLDCARALITTSVLEIINRVVEVKVNGITYSIQMLEESFGDNFSSFLTDWKYQISEGVSSEDDESMADNVLMVPETELLSDCRDEDLTRLHKEFSNSNFGKATNSEVKLSAACKEGSVSDVAQGAELERSDMPL